MIKWVPIKNIRKGSPRSPSAIKAKIAHTGSNKRRMEVFIPEPIWSKMDWKEGHLVSVGYSPSGWIKLDKDHKGLKLAKRSKKSSTFRLVISGNFIKTSVCSPSTTMEHKIFKNELHIRIPKQWLADSNFYCGNEAALADMKKLAGVK